MAYCLHIDNWIMVISKLYRTKVKHWKSVLVERVHTAGSCIL